VSVLLVAETNWLENIALAQDSTSAYLMRLARTEKIDIAVPEYSFCEADGSLNRKIIKRAEKIDDALSLLGRIAQTENCAKLCKRGRDVLKEFGMTFIVTDDGGTARGSADVSDEEPGVWQETGLWFRLRRMAGRALLMPGLGSRVGVSADGGGVSELMQKT